MQLSNTDLYNSKTKAQVLLLSKKKKQNQQQQKNYYTKSHILDYWVCRTTDLFIKDHLWSWQNNPDDKLVLITRQVVLLTLMAKFYRAIRPPRCGNEPPPAEASLCLDTDSTPDIRRLQQSVILLLHKVVQLCHIIRLISIQNTGWSFLNDGP